MSKTTALIAAVVSLAVVGAVAAVLVVQFHGNDTTILLAAIFGFLTPTVASLLSLLQATNNGVATAVVSQQVHDVNKKVDGHLTRLTQIVVDSAARNEPVQPIAAALLAQRTEVLTGNQINLTHPPIPEVPAAPPVEGAKP